MAEPQIRFDDGAAYELMMGNWSKVAGATFLDWVAPRSGLKWIDVGCGNGAFTEVLIDKVAPSAVDGIDPSEGQLAYARTRPGTRLAAFHQGDAMALPFADNSFDAAAMALVIFFVPEPVKGVAEMVRVVEQGGVVAAYAWDMVGGGFPIEPILAGMRESGLAVVRPPSSDASRIDALRALWTGAGMNSVETREIKVRRTFADFEEYWKFGTLGSMTAPKIAAMTSEDLDRLKARVRDRLPADAAGRITYEARANAVKGIVAK